MEQPSLFSSCSRETPSCDDTSSVFNKVQKQCRKHNSVFGLCIFSLVHPNLLLLLERGTTGSSLVSPVGIHMFIFSHFSFFPPCVFAALQSFSFKLNSK